MDGQRSIGTGLCPPTEESVVVEARQVFEALVGFCSSDERKFGEFEKSFLPRLFHLGCVLIKRMLVHRHAVLELRPYLALEGYRMGAAYAERTLRTVCGEVRYGRVHLIREDGGAGFHPLDVALGLTRDGFSPGVISS